VAGTAVTKVAFPSWDDLRSTWKQLLAGRADSRNEIALLRPASKVASALEKLREEIAGPAQALLWLLARAGVQRVSDETAPTSGSTFPSHLAHVEAWYRDLDHCLKTIDTQYDATNRDLRGIDVRQLTMGASLEFLKLDPAGVTMSLCMALDRAGRSAAFLQSRALSEASAGSYAERIDRIAYGGYGFRILRWRLQVWLCIFSENPNAKELVSRNREQNRLWKLKSLWYAAQSAGECGEYAMEAAMGAKLLHEVAHIYSDREQLDVELAEAVGCCGDSVRALGYSVPDDFRGGGRFSINTDPRQRRRQSNAAGAADSPKLMNHDPDSQNAAEDECVTGDMLAPSGALFRFVPPSRLYRIYRKVPRDVFVSLAKVPGAGFHDNPFVFLKDLVGTCKANRVSSMSDAQRQTLFDVCVGLDRLRYAFNILERCPTWTPSAESLKNLAHRLIVAQRALPAGVRDQKQVEWLTRLGRAWESVKTTQDQDLLIHQSLLGRITSLAMGSGSSTIDPWLLADENKGDRVEYTHRFRPLVKVDRFYNLQRYVLSFGKVAPTVVLSAASRGSVLHVFGFASNYRTSRGVVDDIDLDACRKAAHFLRTKASRGALLEPTIWNHKALVPLVKLARRIMDFIMADLGGGCKVLLLAIEPDLAAVPWNVLLPTVCADNVPVASLIPSLSWLRDHERRKVVNHLSTSHPQYIFDSVDNLAREYPAEIRPQFERLIGAAQELVRSPIGASLSVIVGHGLWDAATQMTTVNSLEGPIKLDRWMEFFASSLAVVNSCQGGKTQGRLIADLAGLPGLALAAGCRCVLAPLTRLRPEDLADLCKALANPNAGVTVLDRLNAAFASNPATRQVAAFGDVMVGLMQEQA